MEVKTISFTGHRPNKLGGFDYNSPLNLKIKESLKNEIKTSIELGFKRFLSGGALGIDQWAIEILLDLKLEHSDLEVILVRPFPSQHIQWNQKDQANFKEIISKCNKIIDVSADPFSVEKMNKRNRYLVDHCDRLIAVWDGSSSGTGNTVKYAKLKNKEILTINPRKIKI